MENTSKKKDNSLNEEIQSILSLSPLERYQKYRIDPNKAYEKPPSILEIGGVPFGTLGNFSCIAGKAKSKKTFFLSLITAILLDDENN